MSNAKRRSFLKQLGLASAGILTGSQAIAANQATRVQLHRSLSHTGDLKPIRLGLIGAGGMGTEDMKTALSHPNVSITAVCDLYKGRRDSALQRWGSGIFATNDYKEVLKRNDVDAVIIGTPIIGMYPLA